MLIYTICATRTNIIYVVLFTSLILVFCLLAAAYWRLGKEDAINGNRLTVVRLTSNKPTKLSKAVNANSYSHRVPAQRCSWRLCWASIC